MRPETSGSHGATLFERRREGCQFFHAGLAGVFVGVENNFSLFLLNLHGNDLIFKVAAPDRSEGTLLAFEPQVILLFPGDIVLNDQVFGCNPHDQLVFRIRRRFPNENLRRRQGISLAGAGDHPGRRAPALHTACDVNIAKAGHDLGRREIDSLKAGGALPFHGNTGDAVGEEPALRRPAGPGCCCVPGLERPMTTSSMILGSIPVLSTSPLRANAPSSSDDYLAIVPPTRPIGEKTYATITTSFHFLRLLHRLFLIRGHIANQIPSLIRDVQIWRLNYLFISCNYP